MVKLQQWFLGQHFLKRLPEDYSTLVSLLYEDKGQALAVAFYQ